MAGSIDEAVSLLFVPGNRPDRFEKAARSGADLVILDLEDAVPQHKDEARREVRAWLEQGGRALVRINAVGAPDHAGDVAAVVADPPPGLVGVVLAKTDGESDVAQLADAAPDGLALIPLIESARGVIASPAIAAHPRVARLALGAQDLTVDLRADGSDDSLVVARSLLVLASSAGELPPPIDSPSIELVDRDAVRSSAQHAHRLGFGGKLAIHPAQVPIIHEAFAPTEAQLAWAREIASAADGLGRAAGSMVDAPVAERARRILERARSA